VIAAFLAPYATRLLAWGAVALAVLAAIFGLFKLVDANARKAEQLKQKTRSLEVSRDQLKAAADRPRTRDDLAARLRDGTF